MSDSMREMTIYLRDFLQASLAQAAQTAEVIQAAQAAALASAMSAVPSDPLAHAIVLLSEHKTLTKDDQLEIADDFARDWV